VASDCGCRAATTGCGSMAETSVKQQIKQKVKELLYNYVQRENQKEQAISFSSFNIYDQ